MNINMLLAKVKGDLTAIRITGLVFMKYPSYLNFKILKKEVAVEVNSAVNTYFYSKSME